MTRKSLVGLFIAFGLQAAAWPAADQPAAQPTAASEQLEINKNALLAGPDEQIRLKAASLMLDSNDPNARALLLDVLGKNENQQARLAICQAIAGSQGARAIPNSQEFIGPLVTFLTQQRDPASVRLAAQAMLIFKYDQLEKPLLAVLADKSLPAEARLNVVAVLRLQPDIRAIVRLIELLDDPDTQVVAASSEALKSLGIPAVGASRAARRQMIEEIQRIGKEEFLHYWGMRQGYESQIQQLKADRDTWKQKYLASLDQLYGQLAADSSARITFLAQYLSGSQGDERLWAVAKVSQWLHGTEPKSNLRTELGPQLIKLISDEDGRVRLSAAQVLELMPEMDCTQALLNQIKVETDDDVRTEEFVALGQACRYAFSPQSTLKLDSSTRKQTLDLAVQYLSSDVPAKAQRGAEVIRNLLEHNGLSEQEVSAYLDALADRYSRDDISSALRGELLNYMAALCGQSVYADQATSRFRGYFIAGLTDEDDLVREAAVTGLININKSEALSLLRKDFVNDKSANIRKRLIALAEEVGTAEDLNWLSEKMNSNPEGPPAWKAMLRIFGDANSELLSRWIARLEQSNIAPGRMIAVLEIAERKAQSENDTQFLNDVRYKLAQLLAQTPDRDKAKKYYGILIKAEKNLGRKDQLRAELLRLYLADGQMKSAASLVANRLLEDDIDDESPIGQVLIDYVAGSPQHAQELVSELQQIQPQMSRSKPLWHKLLQRLEQARPADVNNPPASQSA
jgi:HEAT repeat protein